MTTTVSNLIFDTHAVEQARLIDNRLATKQGYNSLRRADTCRI
jgi:hypothetical protein